MDRNLLRDKVMGLGDTSMRKCYYPELRRRQAEEALRESEDKFRVLAEMSSAVIYVYQGENLVYINEAAERITCYRRDELLHMKFWEIMHPDCRGLVRERGLARQRGEPVQSPYELKFIKKGGETRWAELSAGRILYMGKPAGVATFFDITDRKLAEKALSEANAQIELYLDLMGHDINNMNQVALGYLELAEDVVTSGGCIDKHNSELIEKPVVSLNNSSKLIDNVRKLQKIKAGQKKIKICPRDILEEACRQFSGMPGVDIELHIPETCGTKVLADELLIDVFTNIIGNAIKHSDCTGKTRIVISSMSVYSDRRKYCKISIEDNGPGIPDEKKGRIFKKYSRGETKAKGSGLGLYIVYSLVESYGGKVWVEDRVPGDYASGSRFVVMLPSTP